MRILFLDIDGVMVTSATIDKRNNKWDVPMFDIKSVAVLNFILQETGAEIILTSDWRTHHTLQEIREIFAHNFVIRAPIGFTPSSKTYLGTNLEGGRADEIKLWLNTHAWNFDIKWVVIDDLNMGPFFPDNFVHCPNQHEGIKQKGVKEKILNILQ